VRRSVSDLNEKGLGNGLSSFEGKTRLSALATTEKPADSKYRDVVAEFDGR
jgi:hypothetical protein